MTCHPASIFETPVVLFHKDLGCKLRHMTQYFLVLVPEGIWSYMKFGVRAICQTETEKFHVTGSKDLKGPWVTLFSYIDPRSRILDPLDPGY